MADVELLTATRRQGLPRVAGGAPAGGEGPVPEGYVIAASVALAGEAAAPAPAAAPAAAQPSAAAPASTPATESAPSTESVPAQSAPSAPVGTRAAAETVRSVRRTGLPRVAGGAPAGGSGEVPDGYDIAVSFAAADGAPSGQAAASPAGQPAEAQPVPEAASQAQPRHAAAPASAPAVATASSDLQTAGVDAAPSARRTGLPRVAGQAAAGGSGDVPAGYEIAASVALPGDRTEATVEPAALQAEDASAAAPAAAPAVTDDTAVAPQPEVAPAAATAAAAGATAAAAAPAATKTQAKPAATPAAKPAKAAKPKKVRDPEKTKRGLQLLGAAVVGAVVAVAVVMIVRAVLATEPLQAFFARYPGEYALPESAKPGFPGWVQWTHFLNFFFMVLIVRSGLQVRYQKKPDAYWTPKRSQGGEGKISLALWFHQSLDVLWLINGIVFVVLLFVSGHWMRIVPTSWEVFPNALSAALQYVSLDWPVEDGWVNYNSLQQIMYFIVVFIAAPLAAISGVRMSGFWPKKAEKLNRIYPIEVARAIHFPTMLFFVFFVIVHVVLVFSTGMLKNLNHMFGEGPVSSFVGLGIFALSIVVTVIAWFAARPMVLTAIARLTGKVSAR